MPSACPSRSVPSRSRRLSALVLQAAAVLVAVWGRPAAAEERMYFPAHDNVTNVLVSKINAETVRVDISAWYLSEHSISIALINKYKSGVPVRLIGDRGAVFEIDQPTRNEFYWLASQGLPIRLRVDPLWYPEIDHWKTSIFVGQGEVAFGSANYSPFELAPASATNYKDETVMVTDDPEIVNAFKAKFDQYWNDTTPDPYSLQPDPPYFKDWHDACATEPLGCDFEAQYPDAEPMIIDHARLEPDAPTPPDLIWGQGPLYNDRLVEEINAENSLIQLVIYRLSVDNITNALLARHQAGVQVQLLLEQNEYLNKRWPEFEITHANIDKLWAAGVPIKKRVHVGLTHMKTLVTSAYATNASSNYSAHWQRDHDYFISAVTKPALYQAVKDRVTEMWNDPDAFQPFYPLPPDQPDLSQPVENAAGVSTTPTFVWQRAPFATDYDVYVGLSASTLSLVGNVPAQVVDNPPSTYSFTLASPLAEGTGYYWRVLARTHATPIDPTVSTASIIQHFTTAGTPSGGGGGSSEPDIVIHATQIPAASAHGAWSLASDGTAADGQAMATPDNGVAHTDAPLASPADYVDVTFDAPAGVPYRFWIRLRSLGDVKANDSIWVQFSDAIASGVPAYPLNSGSALLVNLATSSSGTSLLNWGWWDHAYWLSQPSTIEFGTTGSHTLRIQTREDGVRFDQIVLSPDTYLTAAPGPATDDHTIVPVSGEPPPPPPPPPPAPDDVVIYAGDIDPAALHGSFTTVADGSAAGGTALATPDDGVAQTDVPLAAPTHYVDVTFDAEAGIPYRLWLRLNAAANSKYSDSVWVQFGDAQVSGSPVYGIGTTTALLVNLATTSAATSLNAWGWGNSAYWLSQPTAVTFPTTGAHTLRIQVREDGFELDQIVLSPDTYYSAAPGPPTNDATIVEKP